MVVPGYEDVQEFERADVDDKKMRASNQQMLESSKVVRN